MSAAESGDLLNPDLSRDLSRALLETSARNISDQEVHPNAIGNSANEGILDLAAYAQGYRPEREHRRHVDWERVGLGLDPAPRDRMISWYAQDDPRTEPRNSYGTYRNAYGTYTPPATPPLVDGEESNFDREGFDSERNLEKERFDSEQRKIREFEQWKRDWEEQERRMGIRANTTGGVFTSSGETNRGEGAAASCSSSHLGNQDTVNQDTGAVSSSLNHATFHFSPDSPIVPQEVSGISSNSSGSPVSDDSDPDANDNDESGFLASLNPPETGGLVLASYPGNGGNRNNPQGDFAISIGVGGNDDDGNRNVVGQDGADAETGGNTDGNVRGRGRRRSNPDQRNRSSIIRARQRAIQDEIRYEVEWLYRAWFRDRYATIVYASHFALDNLLQFPAVLIGMNFLIFVFFLTIYVYNADEFGREYYYYNDKASPNISNNDNSSVNVNESDLNVISESQALHQDLWLVLNAGRQLFNMLFVNISHKIVDWSMRYSPNIVIAGAVTLISIRLFGYIMYVAGWYVLFEGPYDRFSSPLIFCMLLINTALVVAKMLILFFPDTFFTRYMWDLFDTVADRRVAERGANPLNPGTNNTKPPISEETLRKLHEEYSGKLRLSSSVKRSLVDDQSCVIDGSYILDASHIRLVDERSTADVGTSSTADGTGGKKSPNAVNSKRQMLTSSDSILARSFSDELVKLGNLVRTGSREGLAGESEQTENTSKGSTCNTAPAGCEIVTIPDPVTLQPTVILRPIPGYDSTIRPPPPLQAIPPVNLSEAVRNIPVCPGGGMSGGVGMSSSSISPHARVPTLNDYISDTGNMTQVIQTGYNSGMGDAEAVQKVQTGGASSSSTTQPSNGLPTGGSVTTTGVKKKRKEIWSPRSFFAMRGQQCAICCDDIEEKQVIMKLPCDHYFHRSCLRPWVVVRRCRECPLCRCDIEEKLKEVEAVKNASSK